MQIVVEIGDALYRIDGYRFDNIIYSSNISKESLARLITNKGRLARLIMLAIMLTDISIHSADWVLSKLKRYRKIFKPEDLTDHTTAAVAVQKQITNIVKENKLSDLKMFIVAEIVKIPSYNLVYYAKYLLFSSQKEIIGRISFREPDKFYLSISRSELAKFRKALPLKEAIKHIIKGRVSFL